MSIFSSTNRNLLLAAFSLLSVPQLFAITVSPSNPTLNEAAQQQFTANAPATWKTSCSSITSGGLFTASIYPGPCTVTATANDGSSSASSVVNVVSPIVMTPQYATTPQNKTQQFTASTPVTWTAKCGSITAGGLYTANGTVGSRCTIEGIAMGRPRYTVWGADNITSPTSSGLAIAPLNPSLAPNSTMQFSANAPVSWKASCGTLALSSGYYTAPSTAGSCTIVATATDGSGQTASTTATVTSSTFSVSPANVSLTVGGTQQFTASAQAIWAASCGSVSSSGQFTAPSTPGSCTITATSGGGTKATATANITSAVLSVTPATVSLSVNATEQFTASAQATWATSCGSVSATGFFTAPGTTSSCTITATNGSGTKATAHAIITSASSGSGFVIYPAATTFVLTEMQQVFQGQFTNNAPDTHPVSFSVDGIAGGNETVGTINSAGVYTAPNSTGLHTVTARDTTTGSSATSAVKVYSQVAVDFGSRTSSSYPVPAYLLGAERMDGLPAADLSLVTAAGVKTARFYAQIPIVFKTQTPNWSAIDYNIRQMQAAGVHVLLQMHQTPPWLQTAPSSCKGTAAALSAPSDVNAWGKIAAQYVAHMDANFPGVVTDYEIWNEPNTGALCGLATSGKLAFYQTLFAAAAPLMEAQAKADNATYVRVGGPATAGLQYPWVQALLSNPNTAPYVQFMSYHDYMYGGPDLRAQWNTYNGIESVYQRTQNSGAGPYSRYLGAVGLVKAGKQPLGSQLPIYLSEYNMNWAFAKDCCRNDYTLSPVWNGIYVADVLNAAYAGTPTGIAKMIYFGANAKPYFCLIGTIDANMDCAFSYSAGSTAQPYPEYFLYQLYFSPNYLGLESGGHLARSITPGNTGGGLVVTAFYNAAQDAIVIINPTPATYSQVTVAVTNSGYGSGAATLYEIMNGRSISSSSLSLTSQGGTSYTANIAVGPYSVQAISIR